MWRAREKATMTRSTLLARRRCASRSSSAPITGTAGRPWPLRRGSPSSRKPDELDAVLGVLGDLGGQRVADLAGADDQHPLLERRAATRR